MCFVLFKLRIRAQNIESKKKKNQLNGECYLAKNLHINVVCIKINKLSKYTETINDTLKTKIYN